MTLVFDQGREIVLALLEHLGGIFFAFILSRAAA